MKKVLLFWKFLNQKFTKSFTLILALTLRLTVTLEIKLKIQKFVMKIFCTQKISKRRPKYALKMDVYVKQHETEKLEYDYICVDSTIVNVAIGVIIFCKS